MHPLVDTIGNRFDLRELRHRTFLSFIIESASPSLYGPCLEGKPRPAPVHLSMGERIRPGVC